MNSTTDSLPTYEEVIKSDLKIRVEEDDDDELDCQRSFCAFTGIVLFSFFVFCFVFFIAPK